jgi:hypothetical protein
MVLAGGVALGAAGLAQGTAAQTAAPPPKDATPPLTVTARLIARAQQNFHPIELANGALAGAGWDLILRESMQSEFVLIGEEHGTAEIPWLTATLFKALVPSGYNRLAIELSDPVAQDLDNAARSGISGLETFARQWGPGPAFYNWRPEAELLAEARGAVRGRERVIWGLDYEVACDRRLLARLAPKVPPAARAAFGALESQSAAGWAEWRKTGNPAVIPTFALDPALAKALREAWPRPDPDSAVILDTLEATLEINRVQQTSGWASNRARAEFNRKSLIRLLAAENGKRPPKVIFKFGSNHMFRGTTWTGMFDIGSLAPEVAALRGGKSFHLLVGGGAESVHGVLDPTNFRLKSEPADMLAPEFGLGFLLDTLPSKGLYVLDLRPLRRIVSNSAALHELNNSEAVRVIQGFDAVLVWNGATATSLLI